MENRARSYNAVHFNEYDNQRYATNIDTIENRQKIILNYLIDFLTYADWENQMRHCDIYLKILRRIRFNIDSVNLILPLLKDDYRYKVSLNLLYRGIVDDLINLNYLIVFCNPTDQNQRALEDELKVMHGDFLSAILEIHQSDLNIQNILEDHLEIKMNDRFKKSESMEELKSRVEIENPDFFIQGKQKNNKELRTSDYLTNDHDFFKKTSKRKFISEAQKINFIAEFGKMSDFLKISFKYFSQFQHFTPISDELLLNDIEFDLRCYRYVEMELLCVLKGLSSFIVFFDIEVAQSAFRDYEKILTV